MLHAGYERHPFCVLNRRMALKRLLILVQAARLLRSGTLGRRKYPYFAARVLATLKPTWKYF